MCGKFDFTWASTEGPDTWFRIYRGQTDEGGRTCHDVEVASQYQELMNSTPGARSAKWYYNGRATGGGTTCYWLAAVNLHGSSALVPDVRSGIASQDLQTKYPERSASSGCRPDLSGTPSLPASRRRRRRLDQGIAESRFLVGFSARAQDHSVETARGTRLVRQLRPDFLLMQPGVDRIGRHRLHYAAR